MPHFRAFRYRLYPDAAQMDLFRKTEGCCRFVRNAAHEQRVLFGGRCVGAAPHRINYFSQRAELKNLKAEFPWLTEVPHHCLQEALVDLETAWKRFFKGEAGFPRYRSKSHDGGFRFPDPKQFRAGALGIHLPKAGLVPWVLHRPIEGTPKSVTVSREGDHWYASVLCEIARELPAPKALDDVSLKSLVVEGADLGVEVPVATASGLCLDMPKVSERARERERRLHRTIARCKKGSKNRKKAIRALARHQAHVKRRRKHAAHQVARRLLSGCDVLGLEALKVKNMTASAKGTVEEPGTNVAQKAGINRSLLDLGFGQIRTTCEWQAAKMGKRVVLVDPARTSQTCPSCGHCAQANRPRRDLFLCQSCGFTGHADVVAAMNIKARAEEALRRMMMNNSAGEKPARRRDRGGSPWRAPHRATLRSGKTKANATAAASAA